MDQLTKFLTDPYYDFGGQMVNLTLSAPQYQFTALCAFKYHGYWPIVSARDFCTISSHHQFENGPLIAPTFSVEHELVPVNEEFIRGDIKSPSGAIIEQLEEGKCRFTVVLDLVLNGWVSTGFSWLFVSEVLPIMKKMREVCEEEFSNSK
jgi:hypothetical protein